MTKCSVPRWWSIAVVVAVVASCSSDPASTTSADAAAASTTDVATTEQASITTATPASTQGSPTTEPPTTASPESAAGPAAGSVEDILNLDRPVILAHAAGENTAPHSTPYGFAESARAGVDILDFDLQMTADGVLVVQHDDTTRRTTELDLDVASTTYAELHALDNAYWFTSTCTCTGQPDEAYVWRGVRTGDRPPPPGYGPDDFAIPSFATLVDAYPQYVLNIEIKGSAPEAFATADALALLIEQTGSTDRVVVTSFDDEVVDHFHAVAPAVAMTPGLQMSTDFVLGGVVPPAWARIMQVPPDYEGIEVFTAEYVTASHAAGLVTWVWPNGAGEDVAGYTALLELGADGINASDPAAGVEALRAFIGG